MSSATGHGPGIDAGANTAAKIIMSERGRLSNVFPEFVVASIVQTPRGGDTVWRSRNSSGRENNNV